MRFVVEALDIIIRKAPAPLSPTALELLAGNRIICDAVSSDIALWFDTRRELCCGRKARVERLEPWTLLNNIIPTLSLIFLQHTNFPSQNVHFHSFIYLSGASIVALFSISYA